MIRWVILLGFVIPFFSQSILPEEIYEGLSIEQIELLKSLQEPPCYQYLNKRRKNSYVCMGDPVLNKTEQFFVYQEGNFSLLQFQEIHNPQSFCLNDKTHNQTIYYQVCVQDILTSKKICSIENKTSKDIILSTLYFKRISVLKNIIRRQFNSKDIELCD